MKPLFMWAGGKSKLIKHYKPHLPKEFDSYHEPFFGVGAMFIWAYEQNPNASFYINDVNPHIVQIYKAIRDDVEQFCNIMDTFEKAYLSLDPPKKKQIIEGKTQWVDHPTGAKDAKLEKMYKLPKNKYDWDKIYQQKPTRRSFFFKVRKSYQEEYETWETTKEAAILYFLMKTAFNGVWQVGKGHGRFNTPCGLMRHTDSIYDKENVLKWSKALQGATITSLDFKDTINNVGENSYTFLDPPYRSASDEEKTFADYGTNLEDEFQETVIDFFMSAKDRGSYVLLSNRDWGDGFFEDRSNGNKVEYFDVTYTVGRKKQNDNGEHSATKAREILMVSE